MKVIVDRIPLNEKECLFSTPTHGCKLTDNLRCTLKVNSKSYLNECDYLKVNGTGGQRIYR